MDNKLAVSILRGH